MPSNEQPRELKPYSNKKNWRSGEKIGSTELNNIENQIDDLTEVVRAIDDKLVVFGPATSSANGTKGVVPAPQAGDENKYLKCDGTWTNDIVANSFTGSGAGLTNIPSGVTGLASSAISGAMSSEQYIKLDELPTNTQLQTNYVSKSSVSDASGIPNADTTQYGLVKIGDGIEVNNGVISNALNIKNGTGDYSIVEGTIAGANLNTASGTASHAEGSTTTASGNYSHAEGFATIASESKAHAEGRNTTASEQSAHAEGDSTTASGLGSHAEGLITTASGEGSHSEGAGTIASGGNAHAEGYNVTSSGQASHAEGYSTIANHAYQHVFGALNIGDPSTAANTERGNYIEIVGNGTSTIQVNRSNARTLDWDGNETIAGQMTATQFNGSGAGLTSIPPNIIIPLIIEIDPDDNNWTTQSSSQGGNISTHYLHDLTIPGITSTSIIFIIPNAIDSYMCTTCEASYVLQKDNQITFRCRTKPSRKITIGVIVYN